MLLVNVSAMCYVYPKIFSAMRERTMRMKKLTNVPAISSMRYCHTEEKVTGVMSVCLLTAQDNNNNQNNSYSNKSGSNGNNINYQSVPSSDRNSASISGGNKAAARVSIAMHVKANTNAATVAANENEISSSQSGARKGGTDENIVKTHRDVKLTSTLLTVTIAYVTLMTPDIIVHVSDTFSLLSSDSFHVVRTLTQTLYLSNFVINPFIHYWVNSYFKSEFQRRFLRCVE